MGLFDAEADRKRVRFDATFIPWHFSAQLCTICVVRGVNCTVISVQLLIICTNRFKKPRETICQIQLLETSYRDFFLGPTGGLLGTPFASLYSC